MFYASSTETTDIAALAPEDRELQVLSHLHEEPTRSSSACPTRAFS